MSQPNLSTVMAAFLEAGNVKRWHNCDHTEEQKINAHSWGVAVFLVVFCDCITPQLLIAALGHDVHERFSGDMPSPVRKDYDDAQWVEDDVQRRFWEWTGFAPPSALSKQEAVWLRLADAVDAFFWCQRQVSRGNQYAANQKSSLHRSIASIISNNPEIFSSNPDLFDQIKTASGHHRLPESISKLENY